MKGVGQTRGGSKELEINGYTEFTLEDLMFRNIGQSSSMIVRTAASYTASKVLGRLPVPTNTTSTDAFIFDETCDHRAAQGQAHSQAGAQRSWIKGRRSITERGTHSRFGYRR